MLRDSAHRYVGPSVGWSVPFLLFRRFLSFFSIQLLPRCPSELSSTAPAHPHATRVAVFPASFFSDAMTHNNPSSSIQEGIKPIVYGLFHSMESSAKVKLTGIDSNSLSSLSVSGRRLNGSQYIIYLLLPSIVFAACG